MPEKAWTWRETHRRAINIHTILALIIQNIKLASIMFLCISATYGENADQDRSPYLRVHLRAVCLRRDGEAVRLTAAVAAVPRENAGTVSL
jgi:hypothetical protein